MKTKTIKHVLASKKDNKPTILNTELLKLSPNIKNETVCLYYEDFKVIITYKKSRNGKTWYALTRLPNKAIMPQIGLPVWHNVSIANINLSNLFNEEFNVNVEKLNEEFNIEIENKTIKTMKLTNEFEPIRAWAEERGIYANGDVKTQYIKLQEEAGELAKAILKNDEKEFVDAIGDCVVVLTNLAKLNGYTLEHCVNSAYGEIMNRKGKMQNGTFVKEQ
jgi:NTP pyrophosphatase (non-canonical NTP hydrolase)